MQTVEIAHKDAILDIVHTCSECKQIAPIRYSLTDILNTHVTYQCYKCKTSYTLSLHIKDNDLKIMISSMWLNNDSDKPDQTRKDWCV